MFLIPHPCKIYCFSFLQFIVFHEQIQCVFEDGNVCKQNTHTSHIYSVLPFREQIERVF